MFVLPKRKVLVKPVVWEGWLPKGHSGAWLNDGAVMSVSVPISRETGELVNPLTLEEKEFFEDKSKSGMDFAPGDLSSYKKPDDRTGLHPFWYTKEVIIRKPDTSVNNDTVLLTLDLSKPSDYINYKILLSNSGLGGIVSTEWDKRFDYGTNKLVLVEEGYDTESKSRTAANKIEAYTLFSKISKSQTKLYEFLSVYWLENPSSARPSIDATVDYMVAQVEKIIADNPTKFVEIIKSDYEDKLTIHNAMRLKIIQLYRNNFLLMPDEIPVGNSLKDVILYFKDERHQEEKLRMLAQINAENK